MTFLHGSRATSDRCFTTGHAFAASRNTRDYNTPAPRTPETSMGYRTLRQCVDDLARHGMLRRIDAEIDPHLEMAEIQRRVYAARGPALYFSRVKGCAFPMVSNLFGTIDRTRFLFRDTLDAVRKLVELKV